MIDVRCTAQLPARRGAAAGYRCQLLAGHEGGHATMFCHAGRRTIRSWCDGDPSTVRDEPARQPNLPWVQGMPQPAWAEPA